MGAREELGAEVILLSKGNANPPPPRTHLFLGPRNGGQGLPCGPRHKQTPNRLRHRGLGERQEPGSPRERPRGHSHRASSPLPKREPQVSVHSSTVTALPPRRAAPGHAIVCICLRESPQSLLPRKHGDGFHPPPHDLTQIHRSPSEGQLSPSRARLGPPGMNSAPGPRL